MSSSFWYFSLSCTFSLLLESCSRRWSLPSFIILSLFRCPRSQRHPHILLSVHLCTFSC